MKQKTAGFNSNTTEIDSSSYSFITNVVFFFLTAGASSVKCFEGKIGNSCQITDYVIRSIKEKFS